MRRILIEPIVKSSRLICILPYDPIGEIKLHQVKDQDLLVHAIHIMHINKYKLYSLPLIWSEQIKNGMKSSTISNYPCQYLHYN